MSFFLEFILLGSILLVLAKLGGYLSLRLQQPSVLGEMIVGVIIGPSFLGLLHWPIFAHDLNELVHLFSELGVLLLMFVAGLELHFSELVHSRRVSFLAGSLGVIVPVGLGTLVGLLFDLNIDQSIFMGLTLGATSVSISAQTLMELRVLRSRVGFGLLGAAVFDDVLVILLLSLFLALGTGQGGFASIVWVFFRMLIFFTISIFFGWRVLPWLTRLVKHLPISQGVLSLALVTLFLYGFAAEIVGGMAAITGSFLAGLMFARSPEKETIEQGIQSLAYGLFVPIFFVSIGLSVNLRLFSLDGLWLVLVISIVAILGKLIGAGLGARWAGFSNKESLQLGAGMVSRGEVGLILASVGIAEGLMQPTIFSVVVAMVLVTTLITPPTLRYLFRHKHQPLANPAPPSKGS